MKAGIGSNYKEAISQLLVLEEKEDRPDVKKLKKSKSFGRLLLGSIYSLLPSFIFSLGLILTSYIIFHQETVPSSELFKPLDKALIFQKERSIPIRIVIPKISVDLPVKLASISGETWETFSDSASFGVGSAFLDDEKGNTVIFAHAKTGFFSKLNDLSLGDITYVFSKHGWVKYEVSEKIYVDPNDTKFLEGNYGKSLILFTCYGNDDEKRVVVILDFKEKDEG